MQAAEVVDCVGCRMENMMEIPTQSSPLVLL